MKLNAKAFAITFTTIFAILILVISVWARASTQFGAEFMDAFNSVHPHPFRASLESLSTLEHVYGTALDLFYAIIDSLIFSFSFCLLYNRLAKETGDDQPADSASQDS